MTDAMFAMDAAAFARVRLGFAVDETRRTLISGRDWY